MLVTRGGICIVTAGRLEKGSALHRVPWLQRTLTSLNYIFLTFSPSPKIHPGERGWFNCNEEKLDQLGGLLLVGDVKWHLADDLPTLIDYRGVDPAAVAAARGPALGGLTFGARVEATRAVFIEAITQVSLIDKEPAFSVILLDCALWRKKLIHL